MLVIYCGWSGLILVSIYKICLRGGKKEARTQLISTKQKNMFDPKYILIYALPEFCRSQRM